MGGRADRRRTPLRSACAGIALLALSAGVAVADPADPDSSFDSDGVRTFRNSQDERLGADAIALQPDGKVVVAGRTFAAGEVTLWVKRLKSDGSDDDTFAAGDVGTATFSGTVFGQMRVVVAPDEKILVVGTTAKGNNDMDNDAVIARFKADGTPDPTFGVDPGGGRQTYDYGPPNDTDIGADLLFPPAGGEFPHGGKMLLIARGGSQFVASRLTDGGLSATTDDPAGHPANTYVDFGPGNEFVGGAATTSDGKVVMAGSTGNGNFAVALLNPDITPDNSFDGDGKQSVSFDSQATGRDVVVQPDGKIVVAGHGGPGFDVLVARMNPDGSPDSSFSGDGKASVGFANNNVDGVQVALQANGRIVVVGSESHGFAGGSTLVIARLNADGSPDTTFAPKTTEAPDGGIRLYDAFFVGAGVAVRDSGALDISAEGPDATVLQLRGDPPPEPGGGGGGSGGGGGGGSGGGGGGGGGGGSGGGVQRCSGKRATIVGTGKADVLRGTRERDVIVGLGGGDVIRGRAGKDLICGGRGNDELDGGPGRDQLLGGKGKDKLRGGKGRDLCIGNAGRDRASKCERRSSL